MLVRPRAVEGTWIRHVPHGADLLGRADAPSDGRWQRGDVVRALYLADTVTTATAEWVPGRNYDRQVEVGETQDQLVAAGVLDPATMTFPHDHIFENWTLATRVVSGKAQYSGAYQWQLLQNSSE